MRQYEKICIKIIPKDLTPLSGMRLGAVSGWMQTQPCTSGGAAFFGFTIAGSRGIKNHLPQVFCCRQIN